MNPTFLIVDLFCGFGGTTTGFMDAEINGEKICKVIACVNHDPKAIKSHWLNHPDVKHFEEDIRTLDLTELTKIVNYWRSVYPNAYLILWASLECTNFSKAKGGQPRDADSRTLADYLFRYQIALQPDFIQIENVVEFMSWGPLDENGKPISRKNGQDFMRWRNELCSFGYHDEWKEMNAADFGAYTSRNRLFGCFAKHGLPIVWPQATHSKKAAITDLFGGLQKWQPVKDVLNFSDEGESIFTRKKPLSEKTLERIYAGLVKYVAKGDKSFLAKYYGGNPNSKSTSIDSPCDTLRTKDVMSLIQASFISNYKSGHPASKNTTVDNPAGTLTTIPTQALVQPQFLLKYNSTNGNTGVHHPPSVQEPAPTIACQARLGLVQGEFLQHYYGNGFTTSPNDPCPTLTTKERVGLVQPQYFIDRDFKSTTNSSIESPAGTITTVPKMSLVECRHFLINPQFGNNGASVDKPCFTLIAKMDKRPPYLVQYETGEIAIEVYPTDSDMTVKIKQFMAAYGLVDIKMRMLRVVELLRIQGFPEDYKMVGTQADYKKFIGNSVHPLVPKAWITAFYNTLITSKNKVA